MPRNVLINLNKKSLLTLSRAIDFYLDNSVWQELKDCGDQLARTPKNQEESIRANYAGSFAEWEQINLLRKQVAYQKQLLKITDEEGAENDSQN